MAASKRLQLGARNAPIVQDAIQHWLESGVLSEAQASALGDTIDVRGFDWQKFAKYTFRLSVICLVIAVSSLTFSKQLQQLIKRVLGSPAWLRATATAALASYVHVFAYQRSLRLPQHPYANEAIHSLGGLLFALTAAQVMEQLGAWLKPPDEPDQIPEEKSNGQPDTTAQKAREKLKANALLCVMMGLATIYAGVALLSGSNFIWSCALLVAAYCCGGAMDYMMGTYTLYIQSPSLFIALGSTLIIVANFMRDHSMTIPLWSTTRIWGLIYVFLALWILSLHGYDEYFKLETNFLTPRIRMALWSVVFFGTACVAILHGLRYDDSTTKGFGLTFLGINLFTKFFEYAWGYSKSIVFAILAVVFALAGRYAEDIWNLQLLADKMHG